MRSSVYVLLCHGTPMIAAMVIIGEAAHERYHRGAPAPALGTVRPQSCLDGRRLDSRRDATGAGGRGGRESIAQIMWSGTHTESNPTASARRVMARISLQRTVSWKTKPSEPSKDGEEDSEPARAHGGLLSTLVCLHTEYEGTGSIVWSQLKLLNAAPRGGAGGTRIYSEVSPLAPLERDGPPRAADIAEDRKVNGEPWSGTRPAGHHVSTPYPEPGGGVRRSRLPHLHPLAPTCTYGHLLQVPICVARAAPTRPLIYRKEGRRARAGGCRYMQTSS